MNLSSLISETLYKKYLNSQLAGVYLAKYSSEEDVLCWSKDFINKITSTPNHPDILWVERDYKDNKEKSGEKEKDYKVDSRAIAEFITFLNYRPFELKNKLVFITDAHLFTLIVSNKLLKTLEELPAYVSVFLLAPQDEALLQTVESRAIRINLPSHNESKIHSWDQHQGLKEMMEAIKKSDNEHLLEKDFIEHIIDLALKESNFLQVSRLLADLELYKKSSEFNNALLPRMTILKK